MVAVTAFLAGVTLIFLGTRLTARLRWVLVLPLLGLPSLRDSPALQLAAVGDGPT